MLYKLSAAAAWACFIFIVYATLSPIGARPTLSSYPGLEHIAAFGVMGVLFCLAYPSQRRFVFAFVLGSAILLELAQLLTPDRDAAVVDALQKIAGGALGIAVVMALRWTNWIN